MYQSRILLLPQAKAKVEASLTHFYDAIKHTGCVIVSDGWTNVQNRCVCVHTHVQRLSFSLPLHLSPQPIFTSTTWHTNTGHC